LPIIFKSPDDDSQHPALGRHPSLLTQQVYDYF